jgi:hypothetical protein
VFLKEIRGSLAVLAERLGHADRTAALLNHTSTTAEAPLATIASLAALLRGIARRMDLERDVLVLVLTSHGTREGIALEAGSLVRRVLSPANLRLALDEAGIRNRIVIVSSCYSGTFVPALADDHTVVVTASSADTTSFGCSNEREWTFFGDAFFNHGMREQAGLPAAFARARALVSAWESERGLPASNPQISVGSAIRDLLPGLLGQAPVRHVEAGDERPGVMR